MTIDELKKENKELKEKCYRLSLEISNLSNMLGGNLHKCKSCGFLVLHRYLCFNCGRDNSIEEEVIEDDS